MGVAASVPWKRRAGWLRTGPPPPPPFGPGGASSTLPLFQAYLCRCVRRPAARGGISWAPPPRLLQPLEANQ